MHLWGKNWTRAELHKRIGALSQLGGITRFEYCDGKAKGVTALRVRTASGLEFTVDFVNLTWPHLTVSFGPT
jgi:hypothetical protein